MPMLRMRRDTPPLLQYVFMAWYINKQRIQLYGVVLPGNDTVWYLDKHSGNYTWKAYSFMAWYLVEHRDFTWK